MSVDGGGVDIGVAVCPIDGADLRAALPRPDEPQLVECTVCGRRYVLGTSGVNEYPPVSP